MVAVKTDSLRRHEHRERHLEERELVFDHLEQQGGGRYEFGTH